VVVLNTYVRCMAMHSVYRSIDCCELWRHREREIASLKDDETRSEEAEAEWSGLQLARMQELKSLYQIVPQFIVRLQGMSGSGHSPNEQIPYSRSDEPQSACTAVRNAVFGFIRKMGSEWNLNMAYYLKTLCLQFYGNLILDSSILSVGDINIVGHTMNALLNANRKSKRSLCFYPQKILESHGPRECDQFDARCSGLGASLLVTETTQSDIVVLYSSARHQFGCFLRSLMDTQPMLHEVRTPSHPSFKLYQFPNGHTLYSSQKLQPDSFTDSGPEIVRLRKALPDVVRLHLPHSLPTVLVSGIELEKTDSEFSVKRYELFQVQ